LAYIQSDDTRADDGGAAYRFQGVETPRVATTDLQGEFHFADVTPGTYQVRQLAPPDYAHTLPNGEAVYTVELLADEQVLDLEFGVVGNEPPTATENAFATDEDLPLHASIPGVLIGDVDPDGDVLTARLIRGPLHATLTLQTDGSFVYVPEEDFFGQDTFTYVANDGWIDSAPATITINVQPTDDAPTAVDDIYHITEDRVLHEPMPGVLQNDGDADESGVDRLVVRPGRLPSSGILDLRPDGSFDYTPEADFFGTDSFTYIVSDGSLDSEETTVAIIVAPTFDGELQGSVFDDLDRNGVRDAGEPGIAGRTVQLQNLDTAAVLAVETDANGQYRFTGFDLGPYRLRAILPAGYVQTWPGGDGSYPIAIVKDGVVAGPNFGTTANAAPVAVDDAYVVAEDSSHLWRSGDSIHNYPIVMYAVPRSLGLRKPTLQFS